MSVAKAATTRSQRITKRGVVPRDQIFYDEARSTRGKLDAYTVLSQSGDGAYHCSYSHHTTAGHCDCPGFRGHDYCKHLDSVRYWMEVKVARALIADTDDAALTTLDRQLAGRTDPDWCERAQIEAVGDEVLARRVAAESVAA